MAFDFGLRLARCRQKKCLTQATVAKQLGKHRATISGYENNTITPSLDVIKSLAAIYDVSVDYLLNRYPSPSIDANEELHIIQRELLMQIQKNLSELQRQVKELKEVIS